MSNLCNSNTTVICILINHGMQLDQRNPYNGCSLLHHWAANPLGTLIESRADEESPLVVVKLLVDKGADVMALNKNWFSPILHAAHKCHKLLDDTNQELELSSGTDWCHHPQRSWKSLPVPKRFRLLATSSTSP